MTLSGDYDDEMKRPDIDPSTADRLLDGIPAADAPPRFEAVARLFEAASTTAKVEPDPAFLAAMAEAIVSTPTHRTHTTARRRSVISHLIASKLAAAGLAGGIVLSGGVAAAATGNLGSSAQDFLSEAAAKVGFDLPASDRSERGRSTADEADRSDAETPAPADEGKGGDVSDIARTTESTGVDKGAEVSGTASDGRSQAGTHGADTAPAAPAGGASSGGSAPVETPNSGGTGTADGATDGSSTTGTGTAEETSGGRSSSGASNAPEAPARP
ncbi:MAG: hypothetical protein KY443_10855 [Actinobacteria bacterium]|nr:hypothetical protein [Actinomycetota bacterium]